MEILLELNWVRPSGRKDVPGKPIQYITTDDFLSHFNLQKLSDLPNIEELTSAGLIDNYKYRYFNFWYRQILQGTNELKKKRIFIQI